MQSERLLKQIAFIKEIDKIKYIKRKTKLFDSDIHENDAEHSWHLAMMAIILTEHANEEIDVLKVLKMVLILDRLEPILQNISNNGGSWAEYNVEYSKVFEKTKSIKNGSDTLWKYAEQLINTYYK